MNEMPSVLVCDDDAAFRGRLASGLTVRKFAVTEAACVDEAVAALERTAFKFAVVDLRMPGRSGLELIGLLHERDPQAAIVVLTGYGSIKTALEAVKLGARDYLTKPTTIGAIVRAFQAPVPAPATVEVPTLEEVQSEYVNRVVDEYGGNISKAAKALGLHRRSLQRKLRRS